MIGWDSHFGEYVALGISSLILWPSSKLGWLGVWGLIGARNCWHSYWWTLLMTAQWRQFQVGAVSACVLLLWGQPGVFCWRWCNTTTKRGIRHCTPLCFLCQSERKTPFVKMPTNVNENIAVLNTLKLFIHTTVHSFSTKVNKIRGQRSILKSELFFFSHLAGHTCREKSVAQKIKLGSILFIKSASYYSLSYLFWEC